MSPKADLMDIMRHMMQSNRNYSVTYKIFLKKRLHLIKPEDISTNFKEKKEDRRIC